MTSESSNERSSNSNENILRIPVVYFIPIIFMKLKVKSIKIRLRQVALILSINYISILWLESTGFFPRFIVYQQGYNVPDPHNMVWFTGKLLSYLIFPFAVTRISKDSAKLKEAIATI